MTARTDTARLLALIPYLRSHPGVAVTEVEIANSGGR